jgi:16S rRNA (uracil1498-N3)-methyltransferase
LNSGAVLELPAATGQHVARVLRGREGDALTIFNGDGREFAAEIAGVRGTRVSVVLGAARAVDRESPLAVTLVQCVPRGDRMDFVVQKATELGVSCIVPVLSERSVVRLDARQSEAKRLHWHGVAISACEQCGRNRLPTIAEPGALIDYLGTQAAADGQRLVLEPELAAPESAGTPATAPEPAPAPALALVPAPAPRHAVTIAIGPEGGFAPDELDAFRVAGFGRMRLGPRVLRTETAAIAAIVWLQTRFGDLA